MQVHEILKLLSKNGVFLFLDGVNLKFKCTMGALETDQRELIKNNKSEIIEYLREYELSKTRITKVVPINREKDIDIFPLSFTQHRFWLAHKLSKTKNELNIPGFQEIRSKVDLMELEDVLRKLFTKHEVLRTKYVELEGVPYQKVFSNIEIPLTIERLNSKTDEIDWCRISSLLNKERTKAFDLKVEFPVRFLLIQLNKNHFIFHYTFHHIASDGYSLGIFYRDFRRFYGFDEVSDLSTATSINQYVDYAEWQRKFVDSDSAVQQLDYWRCQLSNAPLYHSLSIMEHTATQEVNRCLVYRNCVSGEVSKELKNFCEAKGVTVFIFLHTVLVVLLARYTNETDLLVGTPVSGRHREGTQDLMGVFVNSLVLRSEIDLNSSFLELMNVNTKTILEAFDNQDLPFDKLVQELAPDRRLNSHPFFQIMFAVQENLDEQIFNADKQLQLSDELKSLERVTTTFSEFDLSLHVTVKSNKTQVEWVYNERSFESEYIKSLADSFLCIINFVVSGKNVKSLSQLKLAELPVLNGAQRESLTQSSISNQFIGDVLGTTSEKCFDAHKQVKYYILSRSLQLQPVCAAGELYIEASGNNEFNTIGKAVVIDGVEGDLQKTLLKTGIYARNVGGVIKLLKNDKVVSRYSIQQQCELINARLQEYGDIQDSFVYVHKAGRYNSLLVAYIVGKANSSDRLKLRRALLKHLLNKSELSYLPNQFVFCEAIKSNNDQKPDIKALPVIKQLDFSVDKVSPRNRLEQIIHKIWCDLLNKESICVNDNFFNIGGHSLNATQLNNLVSKELQIELSLSEIFENPTIAGIAKAIDDSKTSSSLPVTIPVTKRNNTKLSYAQQRIWFIDRLGNGSSQYNMPGHIYIEKELNVDAFQATLSQIIDRHRVLKSIFSEIEGEPYQTVVKKQNVPLAVLDYSNLENIPKHIDSLIDDEASKKFDLTKEIPIRVMAVKISSARFAVVYTIHHIACDGWSLEIFHNELKALYLINITSKDDELEPLHLQYSDYAMWQKNWLQGDILDKQLDYWRLKLKGLPSVHSLPLDFERPSVQTYQGKLLNSRLDSRTLSRVKSLCNQKGITLFIFFQSVFALLISKFSNESDVVIGTPVSGRFHKDLEPLIGYFVNSVVLRSRLSNDSSFAEFLDNNKKMILEAFSYQHLPFEKLVDEISPQRDLSYNAVFQIMFSYHGFFKENDVGNDISSEKNTEFKKQALSNITIRTDLELVVRELIDSINISWIINESLFEDYFVISLSKYFNELIDEILNLHECDQLSKPIRDFSLLDEKNKVAILNLTKSRAKNISKSYLLHELVENQARKTPDAIAICQNYNLQLSYQELNARANFVAKYLSRLKVRNEELIGVRYECSISAVVAILGVLKAGAAYLPLDPTYPIDRVRAIIKDSNVRLLLAEESVKECQESLSAEIVCLNLHSLNEKFRSLGNINKACLADSNSKQSNGQLAYAIYTSGSTGKPKGVTIEHRSIVESTLTRIDYYKNADRFLLLSSFAFDSSIAGLFWTLTTGGTLLTVTQDTKLRLDKLTEYMRSNFVVESLLLPNLLEELLLINKHTHKNLKAKRLIVAGDTCDKNLPAKSKKLFPEADFFNEYGPTEASVWSSVYRAVELNDSKGSLSIGETIESLSAYVLDENLNPLPIGVIGQLYLSGYQLARGYYEKSALTSSKFLPCPYSQKAGERMYATGDLVRLGGDGKLDFIGRIDNQIKVRGFRVELSEITYNLLCHNSIEQCVTVCRKSNLNENVIISYITSSEYAEFSNDKIQDVLNDYLSHKLPQYMIPAYFVLLERLPVNHNGKIDLKNLPQPDITANKSYIFERPKNELEREILKVWSKLLKLEESQVSITADFFSLGGHSLLTTRLISQLRELFGLELSVQNIFQNPTIKKIATIIELEQNKLQLKQKQEESDNNLANQNQLEEGVF
ncbi:amino acid adenylation domain-containing protein [Aliikangiella marina]|uniref:Amino acid adenylation domain-containing protein n=1 Tax=Aliikangiella marina TaxID=1712262 RepID=A0A545TJF3_9GAMM|nr:non-ribosomal peptide synthetase [Aliikangiella marina]TQV77360.1 amino acid adenylation domain-containing protein [Aliikangiella marina]